MATKGEETIQDRVLAKLEEGEQSGFVEFDPDENLSELHAKYLHRPETK